MPTLVRHRRISQISKNEYFRQLLWFCVKNMPFRYVFSDVWYASAENMKYIKQSLNRHFIMPLKSPPLADSLGTG